MIEHLFKKLSRHGPPSVEECEALKAVMSPPRRVAPGMEIIRQFSEPGESTLLLSGLAGRVVSLTGGAQQVTAVQVPGDFVDLHAFILGPLDHSVVALTRCEIATAPHAALRRLTNAYPRLTRSLWFLTLVDAAIHRQWLTVVGRRDGLGRAAHLLCELFLRLSDVGLVEDNAFDFPLTQAEVGDILCLSAVHVNRVIQDLRAKDLVVWERRRIKLLDYEALATIGEFDATYLQLVVVPDN